MKFNSVKEKIDFLKDCAKQYEHKGTSPISDAEYDRLYLEAQDEDPDNAFFDSVGGELDASIQGQSIPHKVIMGSLNKSPDVESFEKWLTSRYPANYVGSFIFQHKIDGLSMSLLYRDGKLVQALTRGNGVSGIEITEKSKRVRGVLLSIPCKEEVEVRGECFKERKDFYKKWHVSVRKDGYKNPRNFSAGKINELNPDKTEEAELDFIAYEVVRKDFNFETEKNAWLEAQGFNTLNASTKRTKEGNGLDKVVKAARYYMEQIDRSNLGYDVDGVVVKLNDVKASKSMGYDANGRKPKSNRAIKFKPEEKETELIGVEVNVGRTGKLTPVGLLKPVELGGAMIGRVTLHNFGALIGKDAIRIGSIVRIQKRGDIIPQITSIKTLGNKDIEIPSKCPSCGKDVEWSNGKVDLVCNNPLCVAQLNRNIEKWFVTIGVKGFGKGTISRLTDKDFLEWDGEPIISSLAEMYYMLDNDRKTDHPFRKYEYLKRELGEKTYENLIESIKSVKEVSLPIFIEALGIAHIGTSSKDIATIAPTIEDVDKLVADDLLKIDGFGTAKVNAFIEEWNARRSEIKTLLKYVEIKQQSQASDKLKGKKFCFTGSFSNPTRDEMEKMVGENGGKIGSVSKDLTGLVWDGETMKGKYEKAKALGLPIITQDEFMDMLK